MNGYLFKLKKTQTIPHPFPKDTFNVDRTCAYNQIIKIKLLRYHEEIDLFCSCIKKNILNIKCDLFNNSKIQVMF